MTHEELLAKIDNVGYATENGHTIETSRIVKQLSALRAVVELHKPHDITLPNGYYGTDCSVCHGYQYPCPTIQAIEKELK